MVKALVGVPWDWLVLQASVHGYNLMLLRLSLAIYALARTIRIGSCYSRLLVARRGITAGAALATVELRVLLLSFLDRANSIRSCVHISVYVGDMAVESLRSEPHAVAAIVQVLAFLAAAIASMRMRLSATKSVLCASRHRMWRALKLDHWMKLQKCQLT